VEYLYVLLSPSRSHQATVKLPSISPASHHPNLHRQVHPDSLLPHQARVPPLAQVLHHQRALVYHHPNLHLVARQSSLWIYTTSKHFYLWLWGIISDRIWRMDCRVMCVWNKKKRFVLKTKTVWNNTQYLHWIDVDGFVAIVQSDLVKAPRPLWKLETGSLNTGLLLYVVCWYVIVDVI
jgi:hypothetical protein